MKILIAETSLAQSAHTESLAKVMVALHRQDQQVSLFCPKPELYAECEDAVTIYETNADAFETATQKDGGKSAKSFLAWAVRRQLSQVQQAVLPDFASALQSAQPDIVHIEGLGVANSLMGKQCEDLGIPFTARALEIRKFKKKEGDHLAASAKVFAPSAAVKNWTLEVYPEVYRRRFELLIGPALPLTKQFDPKQIRKKLTTAEDAKVILTPGPIAPHLGQKKVLIAFKRLLDKGQPNTILWVETGEESDNTRKLSQTIHDLGLDDFVRTIGPTFDVQEIYGSADYFVYAPKYMHPDDGIVDATASAVGQAVAAGLPCVVTNAGGAADWILGTGVGAVIEPGSVNTLLKAIRVFITNDVLAESAHKACARRMENALSPTAYATRFLALLTQAYESVMP